MDHMKMYEIQPLLEAAYMRNKDSWEQSRLIAYVIAQCNSTKRLKPSDIIPFAWDDDNTSATEISNEDIERLRHKSEQLKKLIYDR